MSTRGPRLSTRDGHLTFDDVDLVGLAERLPTPFFVFSAARIAENVATVRDAFQSRHPRTELFYASKACSTLWVLDQVKKAGVNVEVNSGGELWKALRAGFTGRQIVFNGVAKTRAEIEQAVTAGIRAIVVDSFRELERVNDVSAALGRAADVALRIDVRLEGPEPDERYRLLSDRADRHCPLLDSLERPVPVERGLALGPAEG